MRFVASQPVGGINGKTADLFPALIGSPVIVAKSVPSRQLHHSFPHASSVTRSFLLDLILAEALSTLLRYRTIPQPKRKHPRGRALESRNNSSKYHRCAVR